MTAVLKLRFPSGEDDSTLAVEIPYRFLGSQF
jgi:hypothetical protein